MWQDGRSQLSLSHNPPKIIGHCPSGSEDTTSFQKSFDHIIPESWESKGSQRDRIVRTKTLINKNKSITKICKHNISLGWVFLDKLVL